MSQPHGRHKEQAEGMIGSDLAVISFLLFNVPNWRVAGPVTYLKKLRSGVEWSEGSIN
jgi:hypothetical protein